MNISKMFSH